MMVFGYSVLNFLYSIISKRVHILLSGDPYNGYCWVSDFTCEMHSSFAKNYFLLLLCVLACTLFQEKNG